jgi:stage III sporulation protein AH
VKVFKRNAVILTVIVFVCAAVYLNWAYSKSKVANAPIPTVPVGGVGDSTGLYYEGEAVSVSDYFAVVRLDRQQARDTAMSTINTAVETMSMSQQALDNTMAEIVNISELSLNETEIESMIKAKGFADCVVFLKDESVFVAVSSPEGGLTDTSVAQIADIITQETLMSLDQIKIVEVK